MRFETHNTHPALSPIGTSLQGEILLTFAELKAAFGKPTSGDGYKVDAQWILRDPETGTLATIYNYKDGKNYLGSSGTPKTKITEWHIGGRDKQAVHLVYSLLARIGSRT